MRWRRGVVCGGWVKQEKNNRFFGTHPKRKPTRIKRLGLVRTTPSTGLNVLARNRRNWQVNFIDSGLEVAKTRFQTFLRGKSVSFKWNVRFENFMHMQWSEENFLKGIVGEKRRLCFWNKHQKIELLFMQLVRYNRKHERVLKYQKTIPENLANK